MTLYAATPVRTIDIPTDSARLAAQSELPPPGGPLARFAPWQAKCVRGYIAVHLHRQIRIEELAHVAQLGLFRFKRTFRQSFDTTPHQYVIRRRIDRAQALMLDSRDSLREIAQACGFAHQAHMSHVFRRLIGQRPARWRRAQRAAAGGDDE
jgi:AraC family transcriptional regulator